MRFIALPMAYAVFLKSENKMHNTKDFLSGLFLFLSSLFVIFCLIPAEVQEATSTGLSARFFPYIAAWSIFLLSAFLIVKSCKTEKGFSIPKIRKKNISTNETVVSKIWRQFGVVVVFGIYFYLFENIGFLIATPLATGSIMLVFGERKPTRLVLTSIITSVSLYCLFTYALKVELA